MEVQNTVVLTGRAQIAVNAAGQSDVLQVGVYDVWSASDTYIKVAPVANDVTSNTGYYIPAGNVVPVKINQEGLRIGSTADLKIHQVL